ncbi:hypothetical protein ACEYW6_27225 [Nostoc sp. UIC 10607]|uniref:hypothetical protein n=1 Tax=Nostoc sp. UIC 10607 TaxID=3045935 RepID=UPI0039A0615A
MRNDFLINTESGCILLEDLAVKSSNGNRISQRGFVGSGDRTTSNISHADTIARTQKLLDRAIAYAWHTVRSDRRPFTLTFMQWVWQLAGSYHLTHSYVQLIEEASRHFAASGRESLAQWAAHKATEEAGHDRLALLDIQSMGYNAQGVVKALIPPSAIVLVNYLARSVQALDPIGCVGYSYTLERIAIGIKEKHIRSVEGLLPPTIRATRCLRVHSSVGGDVEHVEETVEMVAQLAYEERIRVAMACYETALLYFNPLAEDYISEDELKDILKPLELRSDVQGKVDIHSFTR